MGKLSQNFAKYMIYATMHAKGVVEKPDVIGAIFGQTEGLLGSDLELRDLQRTGRIGRIEVDVKTDRGVSTAKIMVPSSLDAAETCLIAAALETIDKVGPCEAKIVVDSVEDVRTQKRKYVIDRAKELLRKLMDEGMPDSDRLSELIKEEIRTSEITTYHGLPAGPGVASAEEVIFVEGRADVINLLRYGIKNVVAIGGSKIPDAVIELSKEKIVTAFVDGDRGGELDLKKLLDVAEIDYVARAPRGKEVEELTKKEVFKALRERVPVTSLKISERRERREERKQEKREVQKESKVDNSRYLEMLDELIGTKAGVIINSKGEVVIKFPIAELNNVLMSYSDISVLVIDGKVDQRLVNMAEQRNIHKIVCKGYAERVSRKGVEIVVPEG